MKKKIITAALFTTCSIFAMDPDQPFEQMPVSPAAIPIDILRGASTGEPRTTVSPSIPEDPSQEVDSRSSVGNSDPGSLTDSDSDGSYKNDLLQLEKGIINAIITGAGHVKQISQLLEQQKQKEKSSQMILGSLFD